MVKPLDLDAQLNRYIITKNQVEGFIVGIGNLSEDPWVMLKDNYEAIRFNWSDLEYTDNAQDLLDNGEDY